MLDLIHLEKGMFAIIDYGLQGPESCFRPECLECDEMGAVEYLSARGLSDQDIYKLLRVDQFSTTIHYES